METWGFFQFEIIINALASSFIWITYGWIYVHYKVSEQHQANTLHKEYIFVEVFHIKTGGH